MISLIRIEHHCDGPWWVWYCEKETPEGTVYGYVESDGHLIAQETFTPEENA